MKNILILTIALLAFTACGSTSSDTQESIALTTPCNSKNDTSDYQTLQAGDVISKPETLHDEVAVEPEVEIFHTEDGMKKVCIKSGTAVILR